MREKLSNLTTYYYHLYTAHAHYKLKKTMNGNARSDRLKIQWWVQLCLRLYVDSSSSSLLSSSCRCVLSVGVTAYRCGTWLSLFCRLLSFGAGVVPFVNKLSSSVVRERAARGPSSSVADVSVWWTVDSCGICIGIMGENSKSSIKSSILVLTSMAGALKR